MNMTKISTGSKYEEIGGYSRAVMVADWIFVSNTAGRNPETGVMPDDAVEQTNQTIANIETVLRAAGSCLDDIVASRVFIQDPADTTTVMTAIGERFRGIDPACTVTCPPLGSSIYKVEIEVTAYRGASALPCDRIRTA
jgi:enamine deaminase RidA (YjgF/YER057c/UK114 family)